MSRKIKAYIDDKLPEVDGENFPQYENFLKQLSRQVKVENVPKWQKLMSEWGSVYPNEATAVEKLLLDQGIDKDYVNTLHYSTQDDVPVLRDELNRVAGNLILEATQPAAYNNLKYNPADKAETANYYKKLAEHIVGMPIGEVEISTPPDSPTQDDPRSKGFKGFYHTAKDKIYLDPSTLTNQDPTILAHELMHKKDILNKPYRAGSPEDISQDFRKGNVISTDQKVNMFHHDGTLNVSTPTDAPLPKGERTQLFNTLKKLLTY